MGYTTCFTGHRPKGLPCGYNEENSSCKRIKNLLYKLTFGIICKKDVSHFITGMAEGIDIWAAETVLRIKEHTFSNITLEAAIPCRTQTSGWNVKSRDRYNRILKKCDQVTFMQEKYTYDCMMKRNKYMVDSSDYVIAVWNGRPSGTANTIRYKVLSNFGTRIAFSCNDRGEYSNLFERCRMEPKEVPGRALYCMDKNMIEFQTALCVNGASERMRSEKLQAIITEQNMRYNGRKAKPIPIVPERIELSSVLKTNPELFVEKYNIPVGMSYATIDYIKLNLLEIGMLAVTGRDKSGKTNFTKSILSVINKTIFDNLTEGYIIDSSKRSFETAKNYGFISEYSIDANDTEWILDEIIDKLTERKEAIDSNRGAMSTADVLAKYPLILLIIDNNDFIVTVSQDKELLSKFNRIIKDLKDLKVCVIFSNVENSTVPYNAPTILKQIKETKNIVMFDDVANFKFIESNIKQQRAFAKPILPGDGYFCFNGEIEKVKTILDM